MCIQDTPCTSCMYTPYTCLQIPFQFLCLLHFSSVLQFSVHKTSIYLMKFIPEYFIFMLSSGILFLIPCSGYLLLVQRNTLIFHELVLYPATLILKLFIHSNTVCVCVCVFRIFYMQNQVTVNRDILTYFFLIWMYFAYFVASLLQL